jgi:hypothetical protein
MDARAVCTSLRAVAKEPVVSAVVVVTAFDTGPLEAVHVCAAVVVT